MGLVSRLSKPRFISNLSLTDEKAWNPSLWNISGSQSLTGEVVNESTALTYSAVWNAVNLYTGTISTLPLHLLRKENDKTTNVEGKRLYRVMHSQFNPFMTAESGRAIMIAHLLTWGNCYAEKVYDGYGEIDQIWPIAPNRVSPAFKDGKIIYLVKVGSETREFGRDQIMHIPGLGFDGLIGYSVIAMARKSISLGMAMETFGSLYFGKGTHPGVVITHPNQMKDPGAFREAFSEIYSGLGNAQQVALLQEGMTIEKIGIPPEDSQFLQSRQFQIPEIARWFNLPPHKLKDLTRSSFNNIESEQISYVTDSILPVAIRFEQNYDMQLLSENEKTKQKMFFRHNMEGLLRGNSRDRAVYYKTMFGNGFMSINEIRGKENLDRSNEKFADDLFVPMNMIPLSMVEENMKNKQNKGNNQAQTSAQKGENKDATQQ